MQRGGGLSEALVEIAAALAAGDVDENAVEDDALVLVLVEPEVEKLPQIAPALRRPEGIGMPDVAGTRVAVVGAAAPQKGDGVARRQQAEPDHLGAGRRVDHMINLARHEPCREIDMFGVGNGPAGVQSGE